MSRSRISGGWAGIGTRAALALKSLLTFSTFTSKQGSFRFLPELVLQVGAEHVSDLLAGICKPTTVRDD